MSKKILVVDDEADVRKYLTIALQKEGYETVTAQNGVEAFELVGSERPDLITLDLMMPERTGTQFYRRLSRDKELRDIPIIVISGLAGRDLALKEPAAVFDKPIKPDEFIAAVKKALGERD
ncbi:MAG: response regulator [Deltaproteobacteria bacterium]|nr:response regulator [Deltaproteobacteria bacterium]